MRYSDWCATFISDYNFSLIIHAYGVFLSMLNAEWNQWQFQNQYWELKNYNNTCVFNAQALVSVKKKIVQPLV